jgi:pimeloyl-ACP methyl ester carboxylesterase
MQRKILKTCFFLLFNIISFAQTKFDKELKMKNNNQSFTPIEFQSEGATLRGRLYLHEHKSDQYPVIIMAHGYSATIEGMVADRYAEVFCRGGFAVVLYDHRNLGISDGEPRQQLDRWTQARGYRDAIDFVFTLPQIDTSKIGLWGDSMSGDEALVVAAIDHRVSAVVAQVPACGRAMPPADPDGKLFEQIKHTFLYGDIVATPETIIGPKPVVSFDQQTIPSMLQPLSAYHWFMEYGARYNTKWLNNATYVSPDVPVTFTSALCTPYVKAAILMMISHDDEMPGANSEVARYTFEIAPQPKKLIEIDGGHFGIVYYPSPLFDMASTAQVEFYKEYLNE